MKHLRKKSIPPDLLWLLPPQQTFPTSFVPQKMILKTKNTLHYRCHAASKSPRFGAASSERFSSELVFFGVSTDRS